MTIEKSTHPDNLDIISKAGAALFKVIERSINGKYIIHQRITSIALKITESQQFQNLDEPSEPEVIVTVYLGGAPSRTFNFKFSELEVVVETKDIIVEDKDKDSKNVESNSTSNPDT